MIIILMIIRIKKNYNDSNNDNNFVQNEYNQIT